MQITQALADYVDTWLCIHMYVCVSTRAYIYTQLQMFIPIYNQQSISTCTPSTAAIKGDNNNSKVDIIATRISKRLQSQVYAYSRLCVCMCVHMNAFCIVSRCTQCIDRDICQQIPAASQHDFVQILATIVTITQRLTTHCTN